MHGHCCAFTWRTAFTTRRSSESGSSSGGCLRLGVRLNYPGPICYYCCCCCSSLCVRRSAFRPHTTVPTHLAHDCHRVGKSSSVPQADGSVPAYSGKCCDHKLCVSLFVSFCTSGVCSTRTCPLRVMGKSDVHPMKR